ncbi:alpha/beta fold hydrolase [Nocardia sp. CDC159]|uniref:Alpha/beta fold hydrolase n=1 Tax=Nocardia pulmonis TaxID=2951408 RepID=A0A9X2E1X7_9NOCA|nr:MULTISPECIES: alpha/beta fold hydrolase [Nocardia]MCM6772085.1 alpha/beta fold hydrolase [Nocardia pulmonis]MCM6785257.1 alpha/beta fold hydrolase [Nocardia sp. CDC159]
MPTAPLVLLHGVGMSARVWDEISPALSRRHPVFAPTMLGHRGGPPAARQPVAIADLVTDIERRMDERGWETAHFAGNSLGGWVAIELARRGRARSVCALSPAGFWTARGHGHTTGIATIEQLAAFTRLTRPLAPIGLLSATVRRIALQDIIEHGDRVPPRRALAIADDLLDCAALHDVLATTEQIEPLDPSPCPITLAWSARDRILPISVNAAIARQRLPRADFEILAGAGHVPMLDVPRRVTRAILDTVARADRHTE